MRSEDCTLSVSSVRTAGEYARITASGAGGRQRRQRIERNVVIGAVVRAGERFGAGASRDGTGHPAAEREVRIATDFLGRGGTGERGVVQLRHGSAGCLRALREGAEALRAHAEQHVACAGTRLEWRRDRTGICSCRRRRRRCIRSRRRRDGKSCAPATPAPTGLEQKE